MDTECRHCVLLTAVKCVQLETHERGVNGLRELQNVNIPVISKRVNTRRNDIAPLALTATRTQQDCFFLADLESLKFI